MKSGSVDSVLFRQEKDNQELTATLGQLCELSESQLEALAREDYNRMADIINQKDHLLNRLSDLRSSGNLILTSENQNQIRKFTAHEKYVVKQLSGRATELSERLSAVSQRRSAAGSYSGQSAKKSTLDASR